MARVFISYRTADVAMATRLATELSQAGHQVWLDRWEIETGDGIPESINRGLANADFVIVCLSALGIARWMGAEVWSSLARSLNGERVKLLPVLFQAATIPPLFAHVKYADLAGDWSKGVTELLRAMQKRS